MLSRSKKTVFLRMLRLLNHLHLLYFFSQVLVLVPMAVRLYRAHIARLRLVNFWCKSDYSAGRILSRWESRREKKRFFGWRISMHQCLLTSTCLHWNVSQLWFLNVDLGLIKWSALLVAVVEHPIWVVASRGKQRLYSGMLTTCLERWVASEYLDLLDVVGLFIVWVFTIQIETHYFFFRFLYNCMFMLMHWFAYKLLRLHH